MKYTCIKFVEMNDNSKQNHGFFRINTNAQVCASYVGDENQERSLDLDWPTPRDSYERYGIQGIGC